MILRLKKTFVENLAINREDDLIEIEGINLSYGCAFSEQSNDSFQITFDIELPLEKAGSAPDDVPTHLLKVKYIAQFEVDEAITQEFKDGLFTRVNAPAIAYPYVRTFISNTLLNAGFDPIMLPSVNFQALATSNNE